MQTYHAPSKSGIMPAMRLRSLPSLAAALVVIAAIILASGTASAKPKKKYHFQLVEVTAAAAVPEAMKADVTKAVQAQVEKQLGSHAQIVATLDGAPDPGADPKAFKKYLTRKRIAGAYRVNVEVTEMVEEEEPVDSKPGELRLVTRISLRMFGETIPDRKMAFSGDGSAAIKTEVGKKVRPNDRKFGLDSAAETAVAEALAMSLTKLALPPPKPSKK